MADITDDRLLVDRLRELIGQQLGPAEYAELEKALPRLVALADRAHELRGLLRERHATDHNSYTVEQFSDFGRRLEAALSSTECEGK